MTDRLTLATSTGLAFLSIAFHVAAGGTALLAGFVALATRKGGTWHRRSGIVFVYAMLASAIVAAGMPLYEGKSTFTGGLLAAYLVFTAWITVKPRAGDVRGANIGLMILALVTAAATYNTALTALGRPGRQLEGVPAGMMIFMGSIALLGAIGDARMIRAGGIQGTRRVARHLWRMCFGLFVASGSFFLGQMKFVPQPLRSLPLMMILAVTPLLALLYWMWRVRLRRNLRGMTLWATPLSQ